MEKAVFIEKVRQNKVNAAILDRLEDLQAPDAWLVSGALFQTVWNVETGRPPEHGIKDYDIFYFDGRDLSWEAEDEIIRRAAAIFNDLDADIEVKNQARVHLWYEQRFGLPYPPLSSACEGIDRFLAIACKVGLKPNGEGGCDLYAPDGLEDISKLLIRPNPSANFQAARYLEKAARWKACWPELSVVAPD
ncbi:nucleotidyltransferase family protein [Tepidicaulis sp. LMO-SS28]|uniref:nucleotidyltransferase family protein n=1 Tax=Tepidicaulis sp. LMO-SS28 TaxID=3447455 RepID=UPI003EE273BF